MIFYFTGTGNSRWVAEALGTAFDEPLVSIADALNEGKDECLSIEGEGESVFCVSCPFLGAGCIGVPFYFPVDPVWI